MCAYAMGISIGLACLTFCFAYLAINLFKEHRFVRMFFLTMCTWSMALTFGALEEIANYNSATNLENMMNVMVITMITVSTLLTFIMLILGIISAFNIWRDRDLDADIDDYDKEDERLI